MGNCVKSRKTPLLKRSLLGFLILGILGCRQPFTLKDMLDERTEVISPLVIFPSEATLYIGSSLTFEVSGGDEPYEFSVSEGRGTINDSGSYTAPSSAGTAVITVTDADENTKSAELTITDEQMDSDYIVQSISNSPAVFDAGESIGQSFIYKNIGDDDGILTVFWNIYISDNAELDGGDSLIGTGSGEALKSTDSSASININGNWPSSAGVYYLIIKLSSGDDTAPDNNTGVSAPFTVMALSGDIDYVVTDITREYPNVEEGSLCAETFDITNIGGAAGSQPVIWTAYASADQNIGGDDVIASGTASAGGLAAGASVNDISISGAWPSAGTWYLLVGVTSTDETITGNNSASNGTYTVSAPPDYAVSILDIQSSGTAGALFSAAGPFSFEITEENNTAGIQQISYDVWISQDDVLDVGDSSVMNDVLPPLGAGGTTGPISFGGVNWPSFGTTYYIFITVSSGDDEHSYNNLYSSGPITVPELYVEAGENNSSTGNGILTNVSQPSVDGGSLSPNQLIKIEGDMDTNGNYDTYEINIGTLSQLDIWILWSTGGQHINLYIWDTTVGSWSSLDNSVNTEPATPPAVFNLSPGIHNFGVSFTAGAVVNAPYEVFIQGR